MDKNQTIQRGRLAKDLLENDLLEEAFEELTLNTFTSFLATDSLADDERTKLWAIGQALLLLKTKLDAYVGDAAVEEKNQELDRAQDQPQRSGNV